MFLSTLYLLLAHLIADFLLQPQDLVIWKHKSSYGVVVHAAIHWFTMIVLLSPFGLDRMVLALTAILACSHFIIDKIKIALEARLKLYFQLFVVDQTAHILILLLGGFVLKDFVTTQPDASVILHYYSNGATILGLCITIIATYAYELGLYQFQREAAPHTIFLPDYKAMLRRLIFCSVLYALLLIFGVYKLAAFGG